MEHVPGKKLGGELVKVLGLEDQGVRSITIRTAVREAATVIVERFVGLDEGEGCINTFKTYELVEKKEQSEGAT